MQEHHVHRNGQNGNWHQQTCHDDPGGTVLEGEFELRQCVARHNTYQGSDGGGNGRVEQGVTNPAPNHVLGPS